MKTAFAHEGGPSHLAQSVRDTFVEIPVFGQVGHALVAQLVFCVKCRRLDAYMGKWTTMVQGHGPVAGLVQKARPMG